MAKAGSSALARINARGEYVVGVTKRTTPGTNGVTTVEIQVSLDQVPVPDRRYAADVAYVNYGSDGEALQIVFGQRTLGSGVLRSAVVVKVYPDTIRRFVAGNGAFWPQLVSYLKSVSAPIPTIARLEEEPQHVVALVGNIMSVGYSSREAVIDFYHYSALAIAKLNTGSELAVEPVLRVDLPTSLLAALIASLNNLAAELPPETIL